MPTAPTLLAGSPGIVGQGSRATTSASAAEVAPLPTPHEQAREAFVAKFRGPFATGPGRFVSSGTTGIGGPDPGLIHFFFNPPVRARPGHWYTFVLSTSEPGSGVLLGMTTGGIETPALWTLDDRAGPKPVPGRPSWAAVLGFKLLLVMQY